MVRSTRGAGVEASEQIPIGDRVCLYEYSPDTADDGIATYRGQVARLLARGHLCPPETPVHAVSIEVTRAPQQARILASALVSLLHSLRFLVRSRASLHLEILALRHQLAVVNRTRRSRLRLTSADWMRWAWLSRTWHGWRSVLRIVQPETVVGWHRRGFRLFWTWKSRRRTGRPGVPADVRTLIRELSTANPL